MVSQGGDKIPRHSIGAFAVGRYISFLRRNVPYEMTTVNANIYYSFILIFRPNYIYHAYILKNKWMGSAKHPKKIIKEKRIYNNDCTLF